jgi:hypothetical protein
MELVKIVADDEGPEHHVPAPAASRPRLQRRVRRSRESSEGSEASVQSRSRRSSKESLGGQDFGEGDAAPKQARRMFTQDGRQLADRLSRTYVDESSRLLLLQEITAE